MAEAEAARDRAKCPWARWWSMGAPGRCWRGPATGWNPAATRPRTPRCWLSAPLRPNGARRGSSTAISTSRWNPAPCVRRQSPLPGCGGSISARQTPRAVGSSTGRAYSNSPPATTGPRSSAAYKKAAPPSCFEAFSKSAASPSASSSLALPAGGRLSIRASRHSTGENPWRPSAPFRSSSPMPHAATSLARSTSASRKADWPSSPSAGSD